GELREDVDVHLRQRGDAQDHQADGGRDDQIPEFQARADDRPHQRRPLGSVHSSPLMLYSVPSSSAAPTVTTGVPAAGPADSSATWPSMSVTVIGLRS